jgi:hypothetical protein
MPVQPEENNAKAIRKAGFTWLTLELSGRC